MISKHLKGKKATVEQELIFLFLQVFVAMIAAWFLLDFVGSIKEDTYLEKIFLSRDIALIIDSIQSSPGNVRYNYSFAKADLSRFTFSFTGQRVVIGDRETDLTVSFPYSDNRLLHSDMQHIQYRNNFSLSKVGSEFLIADELKPDLNGMVCSGIETQADPATKRILVDPGHGGDDTGLVNTIDRSTRESKISNELAKMVRERAGNDFKEVMLTRESDLTGLSEEERLNILNTEHPDIFISIHMNKYPDPDINHLRIYVPENMNKKNSSKFACILLNRLVDLEFTGASILISDEKMINQDFTHAAVMIEIGNVQYTGKPLVDISGSIVESIRQYYN